MVEQSKDIQAQVAADLSQLDGTTRSRVRLLTGLTDEQLDELGGLEEEADAPVARGVGWCAPSP